MSDVQQYKIPQEFLELITPDFLKIFSANLVSLFGSHVIDTFWWFWLGGTGGWRKALLSAMHSHFPHDKYDGLAAYYETLEWYDSDMFDSELVGLAVEFNIIQSKIDKDGEDIT